VTTTLIPALSAIVAFCVTVALVPAAASFARSVGAVDRPDDRRIHRRITPRLGGLAATARQYTHERSLRPIEGPGG